MNEKPRRSHGRKSIGASLRPRDLMEAEPELAGVWKATVITLFPEVFPGVLGASLTGKALQEGLWQLQTVDLRRFGEGRHHNVDDTPVGGGAGMVMRPDVLARAIRDTSPAIGSYVQTSGSNAHVAGRPTTPLILLSPRGRPFTQSRAQSLADGPGATLICGRFEGVDERVIDAFGIEEISLGDFVMTGGEIAAQALIDATVRLIPRVLGNQASIEEESFSAGLLEHPHYTKPVDWDGRKVPDVLLSGHHANIAAHRKDEAERLTKERRPDLWRAYCERHGRDPEEDREL